MEKIKSILKEDISKLPEESGVYIFLALRSSNEGRKKGQEILYIGKAANIKERVKNHFQQPSFKDNLFINQVFKIGYIKTDSEPSTRAKLGAGPVPYRNKVSGTGIEALILEANLIKKYQPKYNIVWRDDKNYFYVAITKEECPRVLIVHQKKERADYIGPFVEGTALKKALSILRKIFPYYTTKKHQKSPCDWCHLGLCPGPNPVKSEYRKNINNLIAVLKGRKTSVLKKFRKEMESASRLKDFEKAAKIRDKITALEKVISHTHVFESVDIKPQQIIKKLLNAPKAVKRIEAYDVSNIQGKEATGSMVTFIEGKPNKNFYRKFKIKIQGKPNDIAMIKEVLLRRFKHPEWRWPNAILIDGGKAQFNAALKTKMKERKAKSIFVIALAKKENKLYIEGKKEPILLKTLPREIFNLILQLRDEAHRFAISYHRKLRLKALL